jgi:fructan beta-fructosidase
MENRNMVNLKKLEAMRRYNEGRGERLQETQGEHAMRILVAATCVMLGLGLLVAAEAKPAVQGQLVAPEKREREFTVENKYLIMPIQNKGKGSTIKLYIEDKAVRQYGLNLAPTAEQADWYAFFTIGNYKGKKARVEAIATEAGFTLIKQSDTIPGEENFYKEPHRPQFHFSQKVGWNNDTNGMVYHNGKWHLFFQHNPVGLPWGNMTWGHATSDDLVHWEQHPDKLFPKTMCKGDAFSGSATVDKKNTAGWGENTLVAFLTDTGCGECIAYSTDGGETFTYYEKNPVVRHNGRDPKVSWYAYDEEDKPLDDKAKELGGHWVMVVYDVQQQQDIGRNAAFYTSTNMKDWTLQSHLPGYYECTDLFELPVDGDAKDTRWVVFAADAKYAVGRFDGKTFTPEHEGKRQVHYGPYYASQTFDNSPDGRRIQVGWLKIEAPGPYNQHFSFPHCLTLHKSEEGIRMFATPIKEIEMLRAKTRKVNAQDLVANKPVDLAVESDLLDIRLTVEVGNAEIIELNVPGGIVKYDVKAGKLNDAEMAPVDGKIDMQVLVDRSLMEIVGNGGRVYISGAGPGKKVDADKITVTATGGDAKLLQFEAHELKSIWTTALSKAKAVRKELAADEGGILPPATGGVAEPVQTETHGLKPVSNPVFIERKDLPKELEVDLGDGVMLEMVLISAGSFSMSGEGGGAIHKVNITKPFYLGNYEVTQEQWEKVMGGNPSQSKGAKSPVEKVSWDDCQKFLDKLNAKSGGQGGKFVLPTEAQWEYACRAGSTTKYCFGDDENRLGEYAWFVANSEWKTHPVGEKKPNPWGLYDMHGNVWEWCQDWQRPYTAEEVTDPSGPATGWSRVFRGGCFAHQPDGVLSIIRESEVPGTKNMAIGFRVSRDNTPIKPTSNDTKVVPIKPD